MEGNGVEKVVGCAILTYQGEKYIKRCLLPLLNSPLKPRVLIVDSSSNDRTVDLAKGLGVETLVIPQKEFNHGRTRELARKVLGTGIVCMFTQDAYFADVHGLTYLVKPLIERKADVAYARQLPHQGAGFFESFPREFNYPEEGHIRSLNDAGRYGAYTFFCSNSCAAYLNSALDAIGGFDDVLLGEDAVATAKLLQRGGKIAYASDALVYHSHDYTLSEEFKRNFDTGLARKGYSELLSPGGCDSKRGLEYVKKMMRRLFMEAPHLIPYGCASVIAKWAGYQTGRMCHGAPQWIKRRLSSQKYYWK